MQSNQLKLVEGVIFNNFRVHAIFNDKTSIIIHPGGECFTYFHNNGNKVQKLLKFVTIQDSMKQKLLLAIHFHNMFGDIPIMQFKEMFDKRYLKTKAIRQIKWSEKDVKIEEGVYSITSIDNSATVSLSPTLFLFKVEYMGQFEEKVTRWINQQDTSTKQNNTRMFTTRPMASNSLPQTCFQFGRVKSVFSICQYPSRWSIPLYLLWSKMIKENNSSRVIDHVRQPNFPVQVLNFFDRREKSSQVESIKCNNFAYIQGSDDFTTFVDSNVHTNNSDDGELKPSGGMRQNFYIDDSIQCRGLQSTYTNMRASLKTQQNKQQKSSACTNTRTMKQFWSDDNIMPREDLAIGGYMKSNFYIHWNEQGTIRQVSDGNDRQIQIHMHFDDSIILGNGQVFQHWILNQYQQADDGVDNRLRFFTASSVPIVSKNPRIKGQYNIEQSVKKSCEYFKYHWNQSKFSLQGSSFTQTPTTTQQTKSNNTIFEQSILCESRHPGVGHFIAFCNGNIKIIFDDFSILRMHKSDSICTILTRQGDQVKASIAKPSGFYQHVASAVQFVTYAFSSQQQRINRAIQKENEQLMVQYQLDKIQRHLDILRIGAAPLSQQKSKPWMKISSQQPYQQQQQSQQFLSPSTDLRSSTFFTPEKFDNFNLVEGTSENKRYNQKGNGKNNNVDQQQQFQEEEDDYIDELSIEPSMSEEMKSQGHLVQSSIKAEDDDDYDDDDDTSYFHQSLNSTLKVENE